MYGKLLVNERRIFQKNPWNPLHEERRKQGTLSEAQPPVEKSPKIHGVSIHLRFKIPHIFRPNRLPSLCLFLHLCNRVSPSKRRVERLFHDANDPGWCRLFPFLFFSFLCFFFSFLSLSPPLPPSDEVVHDQGLEDPLHKGRLQTRGGIHRERERKRERERGGRCNVR